MGRYLTMMMDDALAFGVLHMAVRSDLNARSAASRFCNCWIQGVVLRKISLGVLSQFNETLNERYQHVFFFFSSPTKLTVEDGGILRSTSSIPCSMSCRSMYLVHMNTQGQRRFPSPLA